VATTPVTASVPSTAAGTAIMTCMTRSTVRLEKRSAMTPPTGESRSVGSSWSATVRPRAAPLSVSSSTSQAWAVVCIQVPMLEISEPVA
jgi:hypothetical protein